VISRSPRDPRTTAVLIAVLLLLSSGCRRNETPKETGDDDPSTPGEADPGADVAQAAPPGDLPPPATLEDAASRVLGPDDGFIALDPATGEVQAVVNPDVAVRGLYPPGSTFKALVAYALLDRGLVGPHDETDCGGSYRHGGTIYPCSVRGGHGKMDLVRALSWSCNVFFYEKGGALGKEGLREVVDEFQLLEPTGFDPGEPRGRFPDELPEDQAFLLAAGDVPGLQVTPLSMLVAYGGLVGDGQCRRPWRGDRPRGGVRASLPALFEYQALLVDGLEGAVGHGTATAAQVPGETVLGKTGTLMRPDDPTAMVNWFLGYLVERRLAVCVVMTRAEGVEPAPEAFGRIMRAFPPAGGGESGGDSEVEAGF